MTTQELIDNLILNENAYFFTKIRPGLFSRALIERTFGEASIEKAGRYLLNVLKQTIRVDEVDVEYSICVFKYSRKPTFIKEEIVDWNETKLAYLVIVDFDTYVAISKRNISGTKELNDKIFPIDYQTMSSLFVEEATAFEKLSMNNMNVSDNAVRQKSMEAINLKESVSTFGLQSYILSSIRLNNDDDKVSLSLNSSRINRFGKKNNLDFFISWSKMIIDRILNFNETDTFISSFARPLNFEDERLTLKPIAVLFLLTKLNADYEAGKIEFTKIKTEETERDINLISILNNFSRLIEIREFKSARGNSYFKVDTPIVKDLSVSINQKSISLRSTKLKNVIIRFSDETEVSVIEYFNRYSCFLINFDRVELVYSHRKLFQDSRLLGNTEAFLKVFRPYNELTRVTSEKGSIEVDSTEFSAESIFGFVENEFLNNSQYFICDDLGREWADHIGLYDDNISFFHSKYKDSAFSASAFQDVVGQALKNLGNLSPVDNQFPSKIEAWGRNYSLDGVESNISRIRKGDSAEQVVEYFKELKTYPNLSKRVYLVINFISKRDLTDRLNRLSRNEVFRERNEIIQILWFISSLISSCYEVGAESYIICKP